jgi:hypothetical protein
MDASLSDVEFVFVGNVTSQAELAQLERSSRAWRTVLTSGAGGGCSARGLFMC